MWCTAYLEVRHCQVRNRNERDEIDIMMSPTTWAQVATDLRVEDLSRR
jgi:hypothetical protein